MLPIFSEESSTTRDKIINILASNPSINTKKINSILKKHYALNVTYQAIHKTLKQMVDQEILEVRTDKTYMISQKWVESLKRFVSRFEISSKPITEELNYEEIFDEKNKESVKLTLRTRKEFDDLYFNMRKILTERMKNLPLKERNIYHHFGHSYYGLAHPTREHDYINDLNNINAKAYYFCLGTTAVDIWATKIYENSPIRIIMGKILDSSRLLFIYPSAVVEIYYGLRTVELFNKLYGKTKDMRKIRFSEFLNDLYLVDDTIKIIVNKDEHIIQNLINLSKNIFKKEKEKEKKTYFDAADKKLNQKFQRAYDILTRRDIKRAGAGAIINDVKLREILGNSLKYNKRFQITYYWGAEKDSKKQIADEVEKLALDKLKETKDLLVKEKIKTRVNLLFCDIHGKYFNGITDQEINKYYNSIKKLTDARGIRIIKLSDLYKKWNIKFNLDYEDKKNSNFIKAKKQTETIWNKNKHLKKLLIGMCKKHSRLLHKHSAEDIAKRYALIHLFEDSYLANEFSNSVFYGYCRRETQTPLSNLPTIFTYSVKRGISVCPWYWDCHETLNNYKIK
ncbi:hypothetical protein HOC50_00070 [archaeon]|jgi:DNA-binding PadR family transcriptional regulator|nr:hypothetical protein [archaeon]MBT4273187.1 hypothetical protein [archaeon]MBT4460292.1 hypothetical protein [archaeon]MBT4858403.1 hypothetical protein [archaeon]MBT5423761.1 hypothetical protein [archaeon]